MSHVRKIVTAMLNANRITYRVGPAGAHYYRINQEATQ